MSVKVAKEAYVAWNKYQLDKPVYIGTSAGEQSTNLVTVGTVETEEEGKAIYETINAFFESINGCKASELRSLTKLLQEELAERLASDKEREK